MTSDQILTFLAVTKTGNFTKAAESLSLSQPAVSQQIQSLEKLLGIRLFDRVGKTLRMNAAGARFLRYAHVVSGATEELVRDISQMRGERLESLVIGAINSAGIYLLPSLVADYQAIFPFAKVGLVIGNSERIVEEMLHGNLDLALIDAELAGLRSFQCDFLLEEEVVLAVPANHPFLDQPNPPLEALYEIPLIMRGRTSRTRQQLEIELEKAGLDLQRLKVAYEFDSNEAIKQSICAGLGCGFLPLEVIKQSLCWGEIGHIRPLPLRRKLWLYSKSGDGAGHFQAFRNFLLQGCGRWP